MTDVTLDPPRPPPAEPPQPPKAGLTVWDVVKGLLKVALVLAGLAVALFIFIVWQLQQAYPAPHPVSAAVSWTTADVVLSPASPIVTGRLTIEGASFPVSARVGLTVAVPQFSDGAPGDPSLAPGLAITGPVVRLSAPIDPQPRTCTAPCELQVPTDIVCDGGPCHVTVEFRLELAAGAGMPEGQVIFRIAGGLTAQPDSHLADDLGAKLILDSPAAPAAT